MPALLEFFKTQVHQLEAQSSIKQGLLAEPGKFYVNPKPLKQIAQVPIMPSGLASLPHPIFFIGAPSSVPLASAPEVASDAAGGIPEQAEE